MKFNAFAVGVVLYLITVNLPDPEISRFRVGVVEADGGDTIAYRE